MAVVFFSIEVKLETLHKNIPPPWFSEFTNVVKIIETKTAIKTGQS
jgi:hypothetical protein